MNGYFLKLFLKRLCFREGLRGPALGNVWCPPCRGPPRAGRSDSLTLAESSQGTSPQIGTHKGGDCWCGSGRAGPAAASGNCLSLLPRCPGPLFRVLSEAAGSWEWLFASGVEAAEPYGQGASSGARAPCAGPATRSGREMCCLRSNLVMEAVFI